MLTLGLMEGILSATLGLLVLVGLANENAPLHRLMGPPITVLLGVVAYGVYASGAAATIGDVVGLGFFASLAFFGPLAFMRWAWKQTKMMEGAPTQRATRRVQLTPTLTSNAVIESSTERRVA